MVCIIFSLPNFFGWSGQIFDSKMSCLFDHTAELSFTIFIFGLVMTPALCYLMIFRHVRRSKKKEAADLQSTGQPAMSRAKRSSMKLAGTLSIIFVVFVVCWTPFTLLLLVDFQDKLALEIHLFATMLAHTNSSLNCVLYGLTNNHFRRVYRGVLHLDRCSRKWAVEKSKSCQATKESTGGATGE